MFVLENDGSDFTFLYKQDRFLYLFAWDYYREDSGLELLKWSKSFSSILEMV